MTRVERLTLASMAGALILLLVLFIALQAAFSMRTLRTQIEGDALGRAREINARVDGQLLAEQSALQVLASSQFLIAHDWAGAEARVATAQRTRPSWRNVTLTDVGAGREIWETEHGGAAGRPLRPWVADYLKSGAGAPAISGVVFPGQGGARVAVQVPVFEAGKLAYVLTAELDPRVFQAILVADSPVQSTSALVDRAGLFIARTVAYPEKLGKPATRFVRDAIASRRSGLYPGVTYEGQKSFTAFDTSALTGWSAHLALKEALLARPRLGAVILTSIAALAAIILAFGIGAFAYRQLRERRLEEARTAQSAKLAAVGQLASGIAHDFNNLLMVIDNSLQRISKASADPALRPSIDNALVASDRGIQLIRQLLAFTRSQPLDIGPVDLKALFEGLRGILLQSVGSAVTMRIDIGEDARWVSSNAGQLEMALVNLAVNARDAMPDGGEVLFQSKPSRRKPGLIALDVTDTGQGMAQEVIDRAMEPFFTTKPVGQGTGLGLAQVFGVVSQSNGSVQIHSQPGAGATICLILERAVPPAPDADHRIR